MFPSSPSASPLGLATDWLQGACLAAYVTVQILTVAYCSHRYLTLWRWWRGTRRRPPAPAAPERWPRVTVQLPLYNERLVAERLIAAVAALDYPPDRLEIQVLDDSTDDTRERVDRAVALERGRGVDLEVLRRRRREGYKAGALAAGLARARGELIVVFDADFVPGPDFLRRIVPHFSDPTVGMVQARWDHLNRDRSLLTAAQAVLLDSHFLLEHEARMRRGLCFNFNGTAGAWRRSCIEDAGGWTHDTLTEDLDLSYRAQLRGWRFVFDATLTAPAELPTDMEALKSQQRRWARGSIQTARKLFPAIRRSALPRRAKLEAFIHLTGNGAYALLLLLGLLLLPVLAAEPRPASAAVVALEVAVIVLGLIPVTVFLAAGQVAAGSSGWRIARDVVAALVLGAGLSANNAAAVFRGLGPGLGAWERTPKTGDGRKHPRLAPYPSARPRGGWIELGLTLYFVVLGAVAWRTGSFRSLPFVAILIVGLGMVAFGSWQSSRRRRAVGERAAGARAVPAQSRTILGERRPRRALRVSTTALE